MTAVMDDTIQIPGAPDLPGLRFRRFRGDPDFPLMIDVLERAKTADGVEEVDTLENLRRNYSNLKNCDPYRDMVMVEGNGELIGYTRVTWWSELNGTHIYLHFGQLVPEWRGKGIGRALLRYNEAHLREISREHPADAKRIYDSGAESTQTDLINLLTGEGYEPVRHWYEMVRPDLENLPDVPLPEGIEVRPVTPEQMRAIWEAEVEAFRDHWGEWTTEEGDYQRWLEQPTDYFQPHLWQVAWEGDQVVGMVRNFIDANGNDKFNRKRGWTENISVRRPWRKRGVAKALIARSFHLLKDLGMTEAALGVDTENPSGARQLYESMGFRTTRSGSTYRKEFSL
jgi:mycothiol synthase